MGTISQLLAAARYSWKGQGRFGSEAGAAPRSVQATGALPLELGLGVDVSSAPNRDKPPEGSLQERGLMAALGWPLLAVGGDIDLTGLHSRPPDGKDLPNRNVGGQGIRQSDHGRGGEIFDFQEEHKGILQPVREAEQRGERVEVGWVAHQPQQLDTASAGCQQ